MNPRPILIMAGGTGGHVFPALAVAQQLRARGVEVVWLGTRNGLEARVVPAAGFAMQWVRVSGLRGKGWKSRLAAPFMLLLALWQSAGVMLRLRPGAVLGMGGFVTGPGGLMAWLLRRPLLLHEQNSIAGMTNRWLAPLARCVLVAFPNALPQGRHVGNPVREEIAVLPPPESRFAAHSGAVRLLVLGGSLGAQALNETLPRALARMPQTRRPVVWHQTGSRNLEAGVKAYQDAGIEARVEAFVEDMAAAYGWADLVVCRAGALTVAELAAAGVGAILVPYPHAVDDHQTTNAQYLVQQGAALLVQQTELSEARLESLLTQLCDDRQALLKMAQQARALAITDAAQQVARECMQAAGLDWREAA